MIYFLLTTRIKQKHNNYVYDMFGRMKKKRKKERKKHINFAGIKFGGWRISLNLAGI